MAQVSHPRSPDGHHPRGPSESETAAAWSDQHGVSALRSAAMTEPVASPVDGDIEPAEPNSADLPTVADGEVPPGAVQSHDLVYSAVVARRLQFDHLLWQVPILSLTAQAFLFTIALSGDSSRTARMMSAALALVVTFLSITLMARHRQAEVVDAHWLEAYELEVLQLEPRWRSHGEVWQAERDKGELYAGRLGTLVPLLPGFKTWVVGLSLFGLAALAVFAITALEPSLLDEQAPAEPHAPTPSPTPSR